MPLSEEEKKTRKAELGRKYRATFGPEEMEKRRISNRRWHAVRSDAQKEKTRLKDRERNSRPERQKRQTKEQRRAQNMKKYKLTPSAWEDMFDKQGRLCAICRSDDPETRWGTWCTDHCHKSEKVRGILCHSCNVGLGNFKDSAIRLKQAIEYLEIFK